VDNAQGELWKTDGTNAGTVPITVGGVSQLDDIHSLIVFNGSLYFIAHEYNSRGYALWKIDGAAAGASVVKDFAEGPFDEDYEARELTIFQGMLYFVADDDVHGKELWRTDGTTAGTSLAADIVPDPYSGSDPDSLTPAGNFLYFRAHSEIAALWQTDG